MIQVLIAVLLFTFFAIGGLVADLGAARLAHRQMNGGTQAAALEGMRLKDTLGDAARRDAAARMLRIHYDNDFEATPGDPSKFGAGGMVTLSGGTGSMAANQQVNIAPSVVYKPVPQLNLANARHGDMVSGYFDEADLEHAEDPSYARSDFNTAPRAGWADAFLVRLRRTTGASPLDSQPGVSSRGPQMPYLFARGSLLAAGVRAPGITTRSTAVATERHATLAGPPNSLMTGYGPIAVEYTLWQQLPAGADFVLELNREGGNGKGRGSRGQPDENPYPFGPPIIPPGQVNGNLNAPNWAWLQGPDTLGSLSTGQALPVSAELDEDDVLQLLLAFGIDVSDLDDGGDTLAVNEAFFLPVYWGDVRIPWDGVPGKKWDNVDPEGLQPRVVGFGSIEIRTITFLGDDDDDDDEVRLRVVIRKYPALVWPQNVSAIEIPGMAGLSGSEARGLMELNASMDEATRAAVLAR